MASESEAVTTPQEAYALSALQLGMLSHHLRSPGSGVDVEQLVCTLLEPVDSSVLRDTWQDVVERHGVLRTSFDWNGLDAPRQIVHGSVVLPFTTDDWSALSPDARESRFRELLRADRMRGFALDEPPLLRLTLVRFAAEDYRLIWTFHHALLDGRCFPMVLREVFDAYDARVRGDATSPIASRRPFREYIEWLGARDASASDAFWTETLAGMRVATPIPVARVVPVRGMEAQGDRERYISPETLTALRAVADENVVTLNSVVQGAWAILLSRYSGEDDVVFGATMAGRYGTVPGAESMLGLFINTLPFRVRVRSSASVSEWLRDLRATWLALRGHEHTSLARVHTRTAVPPGQPLFDSMVMFESYDLESSLQALGGPWSQRRFRLYEQNGFPLTLAAYAGERMLLRLEFDRSRFEDDAVERMLGHLVVLLEAIARDPEMPVGALPVISPSEEQQLLVEWAGERVRYGDAETLVDLLAGQVLRTPTAIAVEDEHCTLTYAELDSAATLLARQLRDSGAGRGARVGVCADRSAALVIALVATVKAGAAYVPLDPDYPADRLAFMFEDASVHVLLTTDVIRASLPPFAGTVLLLDSVIGACDVGAPLPRPSADDAAYMIYTSGSTGLPKGALNAHRGIVNRLQWMQHEYQLGPSDVVLQKTPFSFDVSVWEFFWPLMTGATLVMARPGGHRDAAYLAEVIAQRGVTVCHFVPSMLRAFIAEPGSARCVTLRDVMASGEALAPDGVAAFNRALPNARLHNLYGPTECAVDVSYWPCPAGTTPPAVVPIGRAVANTRLYVLDPAHRLAPIGVPGELFLAGVQVGMGYHNRPELTAERFVPDPFTTEPEARMYRTGDRARWRADGTVEYLGRLDFQVKVRGFRIELGEIETALRRHDDVSDCVVIAREDAAGEKRLVAYVVSPKEAPAISDVRGFLLKTLPAYMVPGAFVFLHALPLSSNGKVDRRALPDPHLVRAASLPAFVAPESDAEHALAAIWARVLRVDDVGTTDNFFELGGDSLLSIQIVSQAARAGFRVTLGQVLENPSVGALARVAQPIGARTPRERRAASGVVPLTPVQHWFAELDPADAHHWNQAFLFTVPPTFDTRRLQSALDAVVAHHDALRLRFRRNAEGGWHQHYASVAHIAAQREDLSGVPDAHVAAAIARVSDVTQASLDLERGPVFRAVHFDLGSARGGRLLLVAHHLVVDGVSWRLLREDIESAYDQLARGTAVALPLRTDSFGAWSAALGTLASTEALRAESPYWASQLSGATVPLPIDRPGGDNIEGAVRVMEVALSVSETRDLLQRVPAVYRTGMNDALLAALHASLAGWMGSGSVLVDMEGHGREDVGAELDVSRTVGWFTTIFPVRLVLTDADPSDAGALLINAKELLRRVPRRGLGFGVLRYLAGEPSLREGSRAQILFNYLGQFDQVVEGSSLFGFASEPEGAWRSARARRRPLIEINAQVIDGRLTVRFNYATTVHDESTVRALGDAYVLSLRAIITHCAAPGAGAYTPSDFPLAQLDSPALVRLLAGARDVDDVFPLTPLQAMFFDVGGGAGDAGFQQYQFELEGSLDPQVMRDAWQAVLQRHALLRAKFVDSAGAPMHVVHRDVSIPLRVEDWRSDVDARALVAAFLHEDRELGFQFAQAPLMRVALLRTGDARWTMVWTQHHLLLDRWSWPLVLREVGAEYEARRTGNPARLPVPVSFRDYLAWVASNDQSAAEHYWREEFAGVTTPSRLLPSSAAALVDSAGNDTFVEDLTADETKALRAAARAAGLSLNIVVEGAWAVTIAHLGSSDDVIFGLAVAGRGAEIPGVERMVGPLTNNVPVRVRLDANASVSEWLAALQRRQTALRVAEHASLEAIQRWSGVPMRHRLFETLMVFQNDTATTSVVDDFGPSLQVTGFTTPTQTAYPVTMVVGGEERLALTLLCDRRYVPQGLSAQLARGVAAALRRLSRTMDEPVAALRDSLPPLEVAPGVDNLKTQSVERVAPRSATESVVARIWSDLLGVPELGVTDNFMARGGHSLLAAQIVARVRDTFRMDVSVRTLFEAPSVGEFARVLTSLERKPGQVDRIAQLVQKIDVMSADELRQAVAVRDLNTGDSVMANGD